MRRRLLLSILSILALCAGCNRLQDEPSDAAALVEFAATLAAPAPAAQDAPALAAATPAAATGIGTGAR